LLLLIPASMPVDVMAGSVLRVALYVRHKVMFMYIGSNV